MSNESGDAGPMNIATLRVEGTDSALGLVKKALPYECDAEWRKGDGRRNGNVYSASGFSVTIADANSPRELEGLLRSFLSLCKEKNIRLSGPDLAAELAVGFTVGDSDQYVAGVEFRPSELLSFAECGVTLSVTAYPTSDAANAEDRST